MMTIHMKNRTAMQMKGASGGILGVLCRVCAGVGIFNGSEGVSNVCLAGKVRSPLWGS
jgi:hypothetical protein